MSPHAHTCYGVWAWETIRRSTERITTVTNAATKKDSTKAAEPKVDEAKVTPAAEPKVEAKPRRKARTLEEKIAELQAQAKERAEKKEISARKKFDELVEQFLKAQDKLHELGAKVIATRGAYDFELPAALSVTREEHEVLQVQAQEEEAADAAAAEAELDAESDETTAA